MSAEIIDVQEWLEARAQRRALEYLRSDGWLPSTPAALTSLMELPDRPEWELVAENIANKLVGPDRHALPGITPDDPDVRRAR